MRCPSAERLISRGLAQDKAVRKHICRFIGLIGLHIGDELFDYRLSLQIARLLDRREPRYEHMRVGDIIKAKEQQILSDGYAVLNGVGHSADRDSIGDGKYRVGLVRHVHESLTAARSRVRVVIAVIHKIGIERDICRIERAHIAVLAIDR